MPANQILSMHHVEMQGKRVLIRVDLNVPMEQGRIMNDARIRAILPTLQLAMQKNAAIILLSHLGRPKEGVFDKQFSLEPVAKRLSDLLNKPIRFESNWLEGIHISPGEIVLCENVRFNLGEDENDTALSQKMSQLADIFIMDAFATAHREQASTTGITRFIPIRAAGLLLLKELQELNKLLVNPNKPLVAIVGGSKVSNKIDLLNTLLQKVNTLIVGGGIANTFLAAQHKPIGNSLFERDKIEFVRELLHKAQTIQKTILIPHDVYVAENIDSMPTLKTVDDINSQDKIFDIGPSTLKIYEQAILNASTIVWNGPVGIFETPHYAWGTKEIGLAIAKSKAYSVAGGGETVAAIEKFNLEKNISYISTGGGAFLSYLEGKSLPGVDALYYQA